MRKRKEENTGAASSSHFGAPRTSARALESIMMEGRTGGGGTGSTLSTIHEGCAYFGLRPMMRQSSSEILCKISQAYTPPARAIPPTPTPNTAQVSFA